MTILDVIIAVLGFAAVLLGLFPNNRFGSRTFGGTREPSSTTTKQREAL